MHRDSDRFEHVNVILEGWSLTLESLGKDWFFTIASSCSIKEVGILAFPF